MPSATPRRGYHHGDLRRTLIDVSVAVIAEHGVDALNLRELATRAGVSSGAPYHHFADRGELLAAIADEGFQGLEEAMQAEAIKARCDAAPPAAGARLEALGRAYVAFAMAHRGHFRVMFRGAVPAGDMDVPGAGQRTFQRLCGAVEDCQRDGCAPPGDPRPLVLLAWSVVHGLATLCVDGALPKAGLDPVRMTPIVAGLTVAMFAALARPPSPS